MAQTKLFLERCITCHADAKLAARNELSTSVADTYYDSTHGKLVLLGDAEGATCWDCHDTHKILPKEDPRSFVGTASVAATCSKCHPGSSPEFATAFMHRALQPEVFLYGWAVQTFFVWVIFFTMAGTLLHMGLDLFYQIRIRVSPGKNGEHGKHHE
jgi:hypothetical protein